jgi:hypothetical protein
VPEYLSVSDRGIEVARVVHLVANRPGPGDPLVTACTGDPYTPPDPEDRRPVVFCEACRLAAMLRARGPV